MGLRRETENCNLRRLRREITERLRRVRLDRTAIQVEVGTAVGDGGDRMVNGFGRGV